VITTTPGFSSRSTDATFTQLPQRDGAVMEEQKPGWSNSDAAQISGVSVSVQLDEPEQEPVVEKGSAEKPYTEDDANAHSDSSKAPAKKAAAKKTAAKKG
jgi:hypothetical protein